MQSLSLYELSEQVTEVRDNNVENLLLYGNITDNVIDSFVMGDVRVPFLIDRCYFDHVLRAIRNGKHVILYGSLGNGKSILLKEIRSKLSVQHMNVYNVDDFDGDYIGDIDHLSTLSSNSVIVLDDYEQYLPIIEHIARLKFSNIVIIATARIADHEYHRDDLIKQGLNFDEFNIDNLEDSEVTDLVNIFENLGYWGNKAVSAAQRFRYIRTKNESQISISLLDFLDSPVIKTKITELVNKINLNKAYKSTLLTICLCKIISVPATKSLISEMAGNDAIYSSDLSSLPEFRQLFQISDGEIINSSSIFCICLIKEHFTASNVTDHLLRIASKFNEIGKRDAIQDRVFKSMLKFSFVERILPSSTKVGNLKRYYEDLKINIPWLTTDPHFWLQYAMSFIAHKDYPKAQTFLDQAYDLAKAKKDYYTDNIDTQQARLWLQECNKLTDSKSVFSNFSKAHNLLRHLKNNIYKFRQIAKYSDFYDENFSKLSKKDKQAFLDTCNEIDKLIKKLEAEDSINYSYLEKTKKSIASIINNK